MIIFNSIEIQYERNVNRSNFLKARGFFGLGENFKGNRYYSEAKLVSKSKASE